MKIGDSVLCTDPDYFNAGILNAVNEYIITEILEDKGKYHVRLSGMGKFLFPSASFTIQSQASDPIKNIDAHLKTLSGKWIDADNRGKTESAAELMKKIDFYLDKRITQSKAAGMSSVEAIPV